MRYSPLELRTTCLRSLCSLVPPSAGARGGFRAAAAAAADTQQTFVSSPSAIMKISYETLNRLRSVSQTFLSYLTLISHEEIVWKKKKNTNFDSSVRTNLNSDLAPDAPNGPCSICLLSCPLLGLLASPVAVCSLEPRPPFFSRCPASHYSAEDSSTR